MKSLIVYLSGILLPLFFILYLFSEDYITAAVILLILYAFLYRPYLDSLRLYKLGVIDQSEHRNWAVPFGRAWGYTITQFGKLYKT